MIIEFEGFENEPHQAMAEAALDKTRDFIPAWCRRIIITQGWQDADQGTIARVHDGSDYLSMSITLYPKWFVESPDRQRYNLRHELIDGTLLPIINAASEMLESMVEDKKVFEMVVAQMQRRKEQAAESINSAVHNQHIPYPFVL